MPNREDMAAIYSRQSKSSTRSIDEQADAGRARCEERRWRVYREYDDGASASRFARKARTDWPQLQADLDVGRFGILWLWESSRGDRRADEWLAMLTRCREHGVKIYVETHGREYDMANARDWRTLAEDGIDSQYESEKTSLRILRDVADAAMKGKPHGPVQYGYERVYDPHTRKLAEQRPNPDTAPIVVEIITRASKSEPISAIVADLNRRGVPSPSGGTWHRNTVRKMALNPAYAGRRGHNGSSYPATWPALVDEGVFAAAVRVLSDPARRTTKPGKARYLLSYVMRCAECGGFCQARAHRARLHYSCAVKGCASIRADWLDEWVTLLVIGRLSLPDVYEYITRADDSLVLAARDEAKALQVRLDGFYDLAAAGELTPAALARIEAKLLPEITAAEKRATMAATPPVLRELVEPGADVAARWDAMPMAARREVVGLLLAIRLRKSPDPHQGKATVFDPDRVEVEWLTL